MLSRTATYGVATRSSSMRRQRRRNLVALNLYCATNGCTSYLVVDERSSVARCEICGFTRHLS